MERLISMTDFVLQSKSIYEGYSSEDYGKFSHNHVIRLENYANFLKQPLTLGMFVPCDEDGNVLTEPDPTNWQTLTNDLQHRDLIYRKAKERVLFEGFHTIADNEIEQIDSNVWIEFNKDSAQLINEFGQEFYVYNVEDLVQLDLKLTETAKKKIGL